MLFSKCWMSLLEGGNFLWENEQLFLASGVLSEEKYDKLKMGWLYLITMPAVFEKFLIFHTTE